MGTDSGGIPPTKKFTSNLGKTPAFIDRLTSTCVAHGLATNLVGFH